MPSLDINSLRQVSGVGAKTVRSFIDAGYGSLDDLKDVTLEALLGISGVGESTAQAILDFVRRAGEAGELVRTYRYDETRKNIPPAGLAAQGKVEEKPHTRYSYDPHLPPLLRFDDTGQSDRLPDLLEAATQRPLSDDEARALAEALRVRQPWLEWTGKREKRSFAVDPVALHIHERLSAEAIVQLAQRQPLQRSLFAEPTLDFWEQVKFYQHEMDWANRLILGDSLTVMTSLARREDLAGKVQMIYMDPPYGIKFASNFQPFVNNREVKEREQDLTREPEQVRAYRDTWTLGVHSYLAYLRDRLIAARELLTDSGSIFVQISDENVHRVRMLLDEVFGAENFVGQIIFRVKSPLNVSGLGRISDYLLWYAKNSSSMKYRQLYLEKNAIEQKEFSLLQLETGERIAASRSEALTDKLQATAKLFTSQNLASSGYTQSCTYSFSMDGKTFPPPRGHSWKTTKEGMNRLVLAGRLQPLATSLRYIYYLDDYPVQEINEVWGDTFAESDKAYVVQTSTRVIERCLLMTTDPGDLVLDPTCGSGTTAYVAEQWGRRWITIDTSRVALALARQRLLTAKFDYYAKEGPNQPLHPVRNRFRYESVPHIMLSTISQCAALDPVFARWQPVLADKLETLNIALLDVTPALRTRLHQKLAAKERAEGKRAITDADRRRWLLPAESWQEWEVPYDTDPDWPAQLQAALTDYRAAWRGKMDEVNATIAASAPQETLVDRPQVVKGVVRVSGPFTVEGVQPGEERMDLDGSPIAGAPDALDTFAPAAALDRDPANAGAYLENMIRLLRQDGVRFLGNQQVSIQRLDPLAGSQSIHAEGEWNPSNEANGRRVGVSFGPQYGPLTAKQVENGLWEASRRGFDDLIFAGFTIDGAAQAAIDSDPNPRVRCHLAHIRPDVLMGDLLKDTPSSQIFTVTGLPRVALHDAGDGEYTVEMEGVDIYDPVSNTIQATRAEKVAAWFLDSDYDGKTFYVTQAFFPDKDAWEKLAKALKSVIDEELFAAFSSTRSLPFRAGEHKRIAVKVIDPRGNEVMRVKYLEGGVTYG